MAARGNGYDIILQAFHWNLVKTGGEGTVDDSDRSWFHILRDMAGRISEAGFTVVYLPPLWRDDSSWEKDGRRGGGEGYFWHDFDLDSRYGTKAELKELVSVLHSNNIKVIADLVTDHRDRDRMEKDIWPYPGPQWARGGNDEGGQFEDGKFDLNLSDPVVRRRMKEAMDELMDDYGIDGWRWNYVRGYEVHEAVSRIKSSGRVEYISMGEYCRESPYLTDDPMVNMYGSDEAAGILGWAGESGVCAFDVILKREIQTSDPARLRYGLNAKGSAAERSSVVTFVDNHDTGASPFSTANGWGQQCRPCAPFYKSKAYAFIMTMPGIPCVYWPDFFDWGLGEEISALASIRKKCGIHSSSGWIDLCDHYSGFAGIILNDRGEEALALSIGSDYRGPGDGWDIGYEKKGEYTVWIKV
ncbi:MAG TPA: alpha-amylase family glycosyl hydrolase [Spirochaetota bacterium]|nr:alpha-amylase family glycosyl hydrolase [Spirochaetota bacterium]